MTQEEKKLLIKDLCARLPYGFTVHRYSDNCDIAFGKNELDVFSHFLEYSEGECFKPYLRPMSSMTEKEKKELKQYLDAKELDCIGFGYIEGGTLENYISSVPYSICSYVIDWLNAHHLDYRGLIDKGLALEAPVDMYKTK